MVLDPAANFVRGSTDASTGSADTTISVVNASIFPDPSTEGNYNLVFWDDGQYPRPDQDPDVEVVRVSGRDTTNNDLTVSRGQESTSAASHPSGSALQLSPTAKMFGDIESTIGDFWDAGNSELTADVNNTAVSTERESVTETNLAITLSSAQSISSGTSAKIAFDTENENNLGSSWVDLSNNRAVIQSNGKYVVQVRAENNTTTAADGRWSTRVNVNGTSVEVMDNYVPGTDSLSDLLATRSLWMGELNNGDTVEGYIFQDTGNQLGTYAGRDSTALEIMKVG